MNAVNSQKYESLLGNHRQSVSEKHVLFLAYIFPPVGGAGVQRTAKFVKYLNEFGWKPTVLTVANPSVPVADHSLVKEIPSDVNVHRVRTYEPSYATKSRVMDVKESGKSRLRIASRFKSFAQILAKLILQPDPQILWLPNALHEGMRILKTGRYDAIVATGPPFSAFLLGAALSRISGVPLILDYRDEWDLSNCYLENKRLDPISLKMQSLMQRIAITQASALVATTRASTKALADIRDGIQSKAKVVCIHNGYDADDFRQHSTESSEPHSNRNYKLAYVGTLWNLTSVEPLVKAVIHMAEQFPQAASRLEIVFAGRRTPAQEELLFQLDGLQCKVSKLSYLNHDDALKLLHDADGLCVLMSDVPGAERVVPAKLFEYMASRKPIWAICPQGEVWDLLKTYPNVHLHLPKDVSSIAGDLAKSILGANHLSQMNSTVSWNPSAYERRNLTGLLANVLEEVAQSPNTLSLKRNYELITELNH